MKLSMLHALIALQIGIVDGSLLEQRQAGLQQGLRLAAPFFTKLEGTRRTAEPKFRPDAKRSIVKYGPLRLPGAKAPVIPPPGGSNGNGIHSETANGKDKPYTASNDGMKGMDHGASGGGVTQAGATSLLDTFKMMMGTAPMDPNGLGIMRTIKGLPCTNCTVLKGSTRTIYANGTEVSVSSGVFVHHSITIDATKYVPEATTTCGNPFTTLSYFLGSDVGKTDIYYTLPDKNWQSGYYLGDNTLVFQGEFVNYHPEPQEIFLEFDVEYMPGKWGRDAGQRSLPATKCSNSLGEFQAPVGTRGSIISDDFKVNIDGDFIVSNGHVHVGGTKLELLINDKVQCESTATYTKPVEGQKWGSIEKMSDCMGPVSVKKGDKVNIKAYYDLAEHPMRESEGKSQTMMGSWAYIFIPKEDTASKGWF